MKATRAVGGVRVGDGALVPADDVGSRARGLISGSTSIRRQPVVNPPKPHLAQPPHLPMCRT